MQPSQEIICLIALGRWCQRSVHSAVHTSCSDPIFLTKTEKAL